MKGKELNSGIRGGLWDVKHYREMGDAIWLFGWLVHRQTTADGLVLRGKPLTYGDIGEDTGFPERSLRRWLARLSQGGYVDVKHSLYSRLVIRVLKPVKFSDAKSRVFRHIHREGHFPTASSRPELATLPARSGRLKEGTEVEHKKKELLRASPAGPKSSQAEGEMADTKGLFLELVRHVARQKSIAALLLCLLLPLAGRAQTTERDSNWRPMLLTAVHASVAYADTWSTQRLFEECRLRGCQATELNPLTRPFQTNGSAIAYASTGIGVAGSALLAAKMQRSQNKWARRFWWAPQAALTVASAACLTANLR